MTETTCDLLVVGAGPAGLYAAYYAGFRGLSVVVVDTLPEPGGQVTAMYPEKMIYDVGGFAAIKGRDLVAGLVEQAGQYKPTYLLGRQAVHLHDAADGGFDVELDDGQVVGSRAVLITGGMGTFTPRPLPVGQEWSGRGVVNFVPALAAHAGQDVVVVGGGDSAFDWCLALHPVAKSVTLVHRRAKFRAHAGTVDAVRSLGVELVTDAQVSALRAGESGALAEVDVEVDGVVRTLPAQSVIAALGFTADLGPLTEWALQIDRRQIVVDSTMRTARPLVYGAGDIVTYPGKVSLIATGFGEAATAVNNIAVELDPSAHLFPGHSSSEG
ncbi:NAD(P)/FAD-dependent oxidoreductase [Rhodococcus sp. X156]|uniref:NAD(P)/FAD-dependent oxidoreductase n=1 Tax=Rhodococcus sp. X156 TaxID=2499145 RepID=UPI000FD760BD|nr:NAD(P)/FAD-dependent oxidoreductase [Rhodococcus sp. X156]